MKSVIDVETKRPPLATAIQPYILRPLSSVLQDNSDEPLQKTVRFESFRDFVVKLANEKEGAGNPPEKGSDLPAASSAVKSSSDSLYHTMAVISTTMYGMKNKNEYGALFEGLAEGASGTEVRQLQKTLSAWDPQLKNTLVQDGVYGPVTHRALEQFKKSCGSGKDGSSVDHRTALALRAFLNGQAATVPASGLSGREILRASSCPENLPESVSSSPAAQRIKQVADNNPSALVSYQEHRMQAHLAKRFISLEQEIGKRFPGARALITSTMEGRHVSGAHYDGNAIDFVLADSRGASLSLGREKATALEQLCREKGFSPYNEYLNDSPYKTGPHMHISAKNASITVGKR